MSANGDARQAYLAGIGTFLPGEPVDNAMLSKAIGVNQDWVEAFIGTKTRHFAKDLTTGEVQWSLADICARAADKAIEDSGIDPAQIEFIVMGTATPDTLMPATVNHVADQIGLNQVPTYQLQSGCAGAVQALDLAHTFITSGRFSTGLVLGGDVCSKHLDTNLDFTSVPPSELVNFVLFGDGAGAAVMSDDPGTRRIAVHRVLNRLTGLGREAGQVIEWFGIADRNSDKQAIREDYKAIEEGVPVMALEILWELLDELGWEAEKLDFLLPPQLGGRMTKKIFEHLGVPTAQEVSCVAETGNNGNALPFVQIEKLAEQIAPGQRALGVAVESSKWIKGGFALEMV